MASREHHMERHRHFMAEAAKHKKMAGDAKKEPTRERKEAAKKGERKRAR